MTLLTIMLLCTATVVFSYIDAYSDNTALKETIHRKTAKELSQVCAGLSTNDAQGRLFFPITGKYAHEDSVKRVEYGGSEAIYSSILTLINPAGVKIQLFSVQMKKEAFDLKYASKLDALSNQKTPYTYGMCFYKNAAQDPMDMIETLIIIEE